MRQKDTVREKVLQDDKGKTWSAAVEGSQVRVTASGKATEKSFPSDTEALAWAAKEEWSRLKKGQRLYQPGAPAGEPRLLVRAARAYTGAMICLQAGDQYVTNRYDDATEHDQVLFYTPDGRAGDVINLPGKGLVWQADWCAVARRLLLRIDHRVASFDTVTHSFADLTSPPSHPVSFLSVREPLVAAYEQPHVVVRHVTTGQEVFRRAVEPFKHAGHSLQLEGALSPDGHTLAICDTPGRIDLYSMDGAGTQRVEGDFVMIRKMAYTPDGSRLVALEGYGNWRLLCFDQAGRAAPQTLATDVGQGTFSMHSTRSEIAYSQRSTIRVLDLTTRQSVLDFKADHVIKHCVLDYTSDALAVRTDYGCFGDYSLGSG